MHTAWLLGGKPQLAHPDVVVDGKVDRCELATVSAGSVFVEMHVLLRGFDKHGVTFVGK